LTSYDESFKPSFTEAHEPEIKCLLPSPHGYVHADDHLCQAPLRLTRTDTVPASDPLLSFGQYFQAIRDVISRDRYRFLVGAAARQLARSVSLADIKEILIYGEKHGSDYHPARMEATVHSATAVFAMNVAVTARGKARLWHEYKVLGHLNNKYPYGFLPRTYFQAEALCGAGPGENNMPMFLADWFKGYHEFHLIIDEEDHFQKLVVWDTEKGHFCLSPFQAREVYRQAARIMTLYYDMKTFKQIFPWHHAAGDFVLRAREDVLDVKLVAARQYASMLEPQTEISVHEALLFFLLNLSIRMRLDRLDGVGAVAWAGNDCLCGVLEGFVEGLRIKESQGMTKTGFTDRFIQHLQSLCNEDLLDRCQALIGACDPSAPDMSVIRSHLERHVQEVHMALQDSRLSDSSPQKPGK
jgi:hypothetical protein